MLPSAQWHMPSPDIFIIATYLDPILIFISNAYPSYVVDARFLRKLTGILHPVLASEYFGSTSVRGKLVSYR